MLLGSTPESYIGCNNIIEKICRFHNYPANCLISKLHNPPPYLKLITSQENKFLEVIEFDMLHLHMNEDNKQI